MIDNSKFKRMAHKTELCIINGLDLSDKVRDVYYVKHD